MNQDRRGTDMSIKQGDYLKKLRGKEKGASLGYAGDAGSTDEGL